MKPYRVIFSILLWLAFSVGSHAQRMAIIADPHIQDVEGHPELVRTWESQARSTRLFNENYFAFRAVLDDVARRGIRLVILPGDLTDNGQQTACQAVTRILHGYERRYGMRFFMTTGNHDPNYPVGMPWGQKDFLGKDGRPRVIYSDSCQFFLANKPHEILTPDTVVPDLRCLGYDELTDEWCDFGFQPRQDFLHWERPVNTSPYPDASYLAEPIAGLWLLAIDGSVHTPKAGSGERGARSGNGNQDRSDPTMWNGSWPGYNNVMQHKPFLTDWVKDVAARAKRQGKRLVAFCHYPLVDFNRGATDIVREAWGEKAFDLTRVPRPEVAQAFLDAGLRLHISGHMHLNNTARFLSGDASLIDVQVPSIAGCMPAYKILTLLNDSIYDFQTVLVDSVPGFDTFFGRYALRGDAGPADALSEIVSGEVRDYPAFCQRWFASLVANRYVQQDLPPALQEMLPQIGGTYPDASSPSGTAVWTGLDLVTDLYRLRFAGQTALADIPQARLQAYELFFSGSEERGAGSDVIAPLAAVFRCMLNALPTDHFRVNVRTGQLCQ